jgi:IS30 family transposase
MAGLPPALLRSITWDQETEMARHRTITRSLGAPVYFCDSPLTLAARLEPEHERPLA